VRPTAPAGLADSAGELPPTLRPAAFGPWLLSILRLVDRVVGVRVRLALGCHANPGTTPANAAEQTRPDIVAQREAWLRRSLISIRRGWFSSTTQAP